MYKLSLTGQCVEGTSWDDALNNLSELFQIEKSDSEELLTNAPIIIKRDIEETAAHALKEAIKAAGFEADVELMTAAPETESEPEVSEEQQEPGFFQKIKNLFSKKA